MEVGAYADTSHRYSVPELSNAISSSMNNNILTIIEEVKRQRGDITKINQELKTTRTQIDKRTLEEIKLKQDMASSLRQMKKERDEMAAEIRVLKDMLGLSERKLSEKDEMIQELRMKSSDYLRKINELHLEIESSKFNYAKMQLGTEDSTKSRRLDEERDIVKSLEEKLAELFEKYKEESQKVLKLKRDLKDMELDSQNLIKENQSLSKKLEIFQQQKEVNDHCQSIPSDTLLMQEVQASLEAFEKLQSTTDELLNFSKLILPSSS